MKRVLHLNSPEETEKNAQNDGPSTHILLWTLTSDFSAIIFGKQNQNKKPM